MINGRFNRQLLFTSFPVTGSLNILFRSTLCGGLCLLLTSGHAMDGDAKRGEDLSANCMPCHGVAGNSVNPEWPKLAGQHADYLYKQLQDFKQGHRIDALMSASVAALSEQDMADLARYYSEQSGTVGTARSEMLAAGARLYRAGDAVAGIPACMACHNPAGRGNPYANYPSLSGQHAKYTAEQLHYFKTEARSNDENAVMRSIASKLTGAQIEAVAEYIQGLH